jgi:hypothetical protein
MKVIFKNLGPIKKGEIDLSKRFYLFVGQNNSGKTYTSNLLWCIFNPQTISNFIEQSKTELSLEEDKLILTEEFITKLFEEYADYIKNIVLPNAFHVSKNHFIFENFEIEFSNSVKSIKESQLESIINLSNYDENDIFIEISKEKDSLEFNYKKHLKSEENVAKKIAENYTSDTQNITPDVFNMLRLFTIDLVTDKGAKNLITETLLSQLDYLLEKRKSLTLITVVFDFYFNHKQHNLISLPSERKSYTTFNSHFFRLEKEKKSEMEKRLLKIVSNGKNGNQTKEIEELLADTGSEYTEVMDNLLTKFYKLSEEKPKEIIDYQECVEDLLQIMQGNVVMESKTANPKLAFSIQNSKENLGMYLASSSVNQLSALLYFFRYWAAKEANFLMMDEPEENLSPSNQTKLIDVLYKYVATNNNRLLLTTHSPLIAKCINNYLHLGFLKEKGLIEKVIENENLSLEPEKVLNAADFGVYFFDGERVIDYVEKEGNEYGVFFREFEKAITKVNNFSDTLKNYIYDFIEENG